MAEKKRSRRRRKGRSDSADPTRLDETRGVFMISVAAELAEMHPQTLRMYEARGLISPQRSAKNTRLYSQRDVERLRRIQQMTGEEGLNLAGVETVLELERTVERMRADLARMREHTRQVEQQMAAELERARQSLKAEIVPYGAYDVIPGNDMGRADDDVGRARDAKTIKIRVQRPSRRDGSSGGRTRR